jgi:NAD(P)-dependent dehydrogenase (short-subunit alcohol dehydrogenase family)
MEIIVKKALLSAFVFVFLLTLSVPCMAAGQDSREQTAQKAVLITGASTGIGRKIAEDLASQGIFVYAGARKQKDMDALNQITNVQAVRLDVTIPEEIEAAVETVRNGGKGLYGLVNNAGVYIGGPLIEVDIDELQWLMDINVNGIYRVTQAFAPMIIESKGRIINISSISGINTSRFSGHYSMSKHAVEAYTDALAIEMEKFGVEVSVIEPGNYDSAIGATARKRMAGKLAAEKSPYYSEELTEWLSGSWERGQYKGPGEVSEAAQHALSNDKPLRRYMVVPSEPEAAWSIDKVIQELVEFNQWQAYSYSREQLIDKLDAALKAADELQCLNCSE